MAETRGDHAVKGNLAVKGDAKFSKGLDSPYLEIVDSKARGTAGGTFDEATWRTRDLTSVNFDDFAVSVTVAASPGDGGDIILPKGIYYAEIECPAFYVNNHVARLADVTDNPGDTADTVVLGSVETAPSARIKEDKGVQTRSKVTGRFTLTDQRTLEIQHRCQHTKMDNGFGIDGNFYETNNVFTVVKMWQLKSRSDA